MSNRITVDDLPALAVSWVLNPEDPDFSNHIRLEKCDRPDGPPRYALRLRGWVWDRYEREWEHEPLPSSRDDAFFCRCRFPTPEEALSEYGKYLG